MNNDTRKYAVVTGASTGIGLELARLAAERGHDLLVVADEPRIEEAATELRKRGTDVQALEADLSTFEGNDALLAATNGRPIDALFANAGRGLGHAFVEQDVAAWRRVIDTNVTGTTYLLQKVAQQMKGRGRGRILVTGSIAGYLPGAYQAVYNGTKAYLDSFSQALREELRDTGVSVTCLMPGATATEFFARADMLDTRIGSQEKDDPAKVARDGFEAMMKGDGQVVSGFKNKVQVAFAHVAPASVVAKIHRVIAEPGSARHARH